MNLSDDSYYAALTSRDDRFDGRFFAGVSTTGIFCRPVCSARKPKRANVQFFATAAAAQDAGFRPCLVCRPESAAGSPPWMGKSAQAARARTLIEAGYLDENDLTSLAQRVGIGERQLRRIVLAEFGATPTQLAAMRRLLLAKKLLSDTSLPVTEIAFGSGFGSVRRFNDAIRSTYQRSPTSFRKSDARDQQTQTAIRLHYRPPFDWQATLKFLAFRVTPGVEEVAGHCYRRTVQLGQCRGMVELDHLENRNAIEIRFSPGLLPKLTSLTARTRRVCDLDADVDAIAKWLDQYSTFSTDQDQPAAARMPGAWSPFECAVRAIVGQQISVKATKTVLGRIVQRHGERYEGADDSTTSLACFFPTAQALAEATLDGIGMPGRRAATITFMSKAIVNGELSLTPGTDPAMVYRQLIAIPGIGDWTAQYILMRGLKEPDAFPAGDLVVQKALTTDGLRPNTRQTEELSQPWRPWRAYATARLWQQATGQ